MEVLAVGMGVFPAGFGPHLIDGAIVAGAKKRAGCGVEHVVAFFVEVEILGDKISRPLAKVGSDPVDVYIPENRAGGLAAIGALQAVDISENGFMECCNGIIQRFGFALAQFLEEFFIDFLLLFCPLAKLGQ